MYWKRRITDVVKEDMELVGATVEPGIECVEGTGCSAAADLPSDASV